MSEKYVNKALRVMGYGMLRIDYLDEIVVEGCGSLKEHQPMWLG